MTTLAEIKNLLDAINWCTAYRKRRAREVLDDDDASQDAKLAALLDLVDDPSQVKLCRHLRPNTVAVVNGQLWVGSEVWERLNGLPRAQP